MGRKHPRCWPSMRQSNLQKNIINIEKKGIDFCTEKEIDAAGAQVGAHQVIVYYLFAFKCSLHDRSEVWEY